MKTYLKLAPFGLLMSGLAILGCADRTDRNAVQASREAVQEAEQRTAEVRQETAEDIAKADAAAAKARTEGSEAIAEQQQEAAKAKSELEQTEARHQATMARDKFVTDHDSKLTAAAHHIDALKERAGGEEGAARDATNKQVTDLQTAHDRAKEALDNLKSTDDVLDWGMHRDNVNKAFATLQATMDQTK